MSAIPESLVLGANFNDLDGGSLSLSYARRPADLDQDGTVGSVAIVSGAQFGAGALELVGAAGARVEYIGPGLVDALVQTGTISMWIKPGYSGAPTENQFFFHCLSAPSNNEIIVQHLSAGLVRILIRDSAGAVVGSPNGAWLPTAGVWYHIEASWDFTIGATRIFVDGVQLGTTDTDTGTRSTATDEVRIGHLTFDTDFAIDELLVHDVVLHTGNFTPPTLEQSYTGEAVDRAQGNLLSQYRLSTKLQELVKALNLEVQVHEDFQQEILLETLLANAEGVQLDNIYGQLVGQLRGFMDDDQYRLVLSIRIAVNHSDASVNEILNIAATLFGVPIEYRQHGRASYTLQWVIPTPTDLEFAQLSSRLLGDATGGGISYQFVEGNDPDAKRFGSGPGFGVGKFGHLVGTSNG